MPWSRVAKSIAEKKEVVTWIEQNGVVPTRAAAYFQNERGWKVSGAQVRYWWKQKESINSAPICNLRLKGAGAKPRLDEVEDMSFDHTVDVTGARNVVLKSTGFASMCITSVLAVSASGQKFPPLIAWKGANQDGCVERIGNTYVTYQKRTWVDSELLIKWLDLVFPPNFDASTPGKAIVWDSMRAHISKAVEARVVKKDLQMFVIPGGLRPVPDDVMDHSVAAAGFSPTYEDWHISRHDVYGDLFCCKWLSRDEESDDDDVGEELLKNMDEFTIWDSEASV
ncbi:unnamed protein product [Phytophthora fragariaefolia]|uniref:Unnamed protein product n=1 Tax=Phytophthora fragariaefolia TaxID=1490495 RepID=A0A9W6XNT5_9STRA|nr:unnamed protein product [Phytophthora fragariaefolia]